MLANLGLTGSLTQNTEYRIFIVFGSIDICLSTAYSYKVTQIKTTQEVKKNERFLILTGQNNVRIFGIRCL